MNNIWMNVSLSCPLAYVKFIPVWLAMLPYGLHLNGIKWLGNLLPSNLHFIVLTILMCNFLSIKLILLLLSVLLVFCEPEMTHVVKQGPDQHTWQISGNVWWRLTAFIPGCTGNYSFMHGSSWLTHRSKTNFNNNMLR